MVADLVENFLVTTPGATWNDLRELMDRCYWEAIDTMEVLQRIWNMTEGESINEYKFKVVSFLLGLNRDQEIEKQLLGIFRRGLQRMLVQTHIIRQDPATLKDAARTAISELSILSHVMSESSQDIMEVNHHRQGINIQMLNRNRD